ncbi:hypothetical protein [Micromonospora sp. WMMD737]|uniref:hypothetical protein n=1 Tax=Micromonospora sp. WMMD737 TaxID=3404113 RepID=UPI003B9497C8
MDEPDDTPSTKGRWLTREKLVLAIVVPVCLALLSAGLTWWINRPKTELEVVDLAVVAGKDADKPMSPTGEFEVVPPKIQVVLRNIGDQVSVVTGAELEVLDYAYLPQCQKGAGPIMVSQRYNAVLPLDPRPHETIPVRTVQEIGPNSTDRFEIAIQLHNPDAANGVHMYRLKVSLIRDGAKRIDAGVAVVGAPTVYAPYLDPDVLSAPDEVGDCTRQLKIDYERSQEWEGARAPSLPG